MENIQDKNIKEKKFNKEYLRSKISSFKKKYSSGNYNKINMNHYLFIAVFILACIGLFVLLSASSYLTIKYNEDRYYYLTRHAFILIFGFIIMIGLSKLNYKYYYNYSVFIYTIAIILLILCYVPGFSVTTNGARRSIKIIFTFMPSDLVKPAAIIMISKIIVDNIKNGNSESWLHALFKPLLLIGIPFILIFFQTDLSTAIVFILSLGLLYLIAGIKKKFLIPLLLIIIMVGIAGYNLLKGYQIDRIIAFLDPEKYYDNLSWQTLNSLFAISRGGFSGVGFGQSIYKHGYLADEVSNDMIFAVIGEEFGFVGSVAFIILVFIITYLIIAEGLKSKDKFAKLLCLGIGLMYYIQSMVNIGVAISIIPNTGITLPFISNGRTSVIAYSIMFGMVLNISRKNNYDKKMEKIKMKKKNNNIA